ncbi:PilZ domain-containing protein [bacterium]|nr:PilZ domain-containing protein [bacterium]
MGKNPQDPLRPVSLQGKSLRKIQQNEEEKARQDQQRPPASPRSSDGVPLGGPRSSAGNRLLDGSVPPMPPVAPPPKAPDASRRTRAKHRDAWAAILWGEPEDAASALATAEQEPEQAPQPPAQAAPKPPKPHIPGGTSRGSRRRTCSFPGVLRIMVPEETFTPRTLAVRIVDISLSGARLETRQLDEPYARVLDRDPRHLRLEALFPRREKTTLTGKLIWCRYDPEISVLGIQFDEGPEDLTHIFLPENHFETDPDTYCLSPPVLDPFPSVTSRENLLLTGKVAEADIVVLRVGPEATEIPVTNHRFRAEVPLRVGRSNFFSFTAVREDRSSIPTPVCVLHRPEEEAGQTRLPSGLFDQVQVDPEGQEVVVRLSGSPGRFVPAIKTLSEVLKHAEECSLTYTLKGDARLAARILRGEKVEDDGEGFT